MENAKLTVREGKEKKIIGELHFESGKKMPFPQHQLKDASLDGAEVQVERQAGNIVLVQHGDEILYRTQSQPAQVAGSKSLRQPGHVSHTTHDQTPSPFAAQVPNQPVEGKDWHYEHLSYVRNPAYATYNFVPLNRKVVKINSTIPPANKYDSNRHTGWIELEIEALTPLYIRGTLTKDEVEAELESKEKPDFFAPVGRIRIPGSSLRGMVRNMVEMISFGRFHFFEDRRLYYRGLADRSNLRAEYQQRMSSYDRRSSRTKYNFSVGILRKRERSKKGLYYEIKSSDGNFKQIFKNEARKKVHESGAKYEPFNFYKVEEGYIVVSGDMPNKKRDWLIRFPAVNAEVVPIPDEDVRGYNNDRTRDVRVQNLLELARKDKEGVPCFYVRWQDAKGNDRVSFGHTGMFRLAYEKTVGDHLSEELKNNGKIDFTDAVFGNEHTFAGRVFFEDAFLADPQSNPQFDEVQMPRILSAPKPTTFQHYLVQSSDGVRQLNHYNSNTVLRGYKVYWHKSGVTERWVQTDQKSIEQHGSQYTRIKPVKKETKFHGKIRFENLSDKELGALLFALDLPEGCAHKIGMGKPLGLGSVQLTPSLHLSNRPKRYQDFFEELDNDIPATDSERVRNMKHEFEQYVLQELDEISDKRLWETDRLRELLVVLNMDVGKELERKGVNRYMSIAPQNEFKNRYVLPKPTTLVSSSDVDKIMANLKGQLPVEKQKPDFIKEVKIKGLWDTFDINWAIDPEVSILVGVNGSGKTTILELIRHALEGNYEKKVQYAPQEFTITFDNGERIHYQGKKQIKKPNFRLKTEFISTFDILIESGGVNNQKKPSEFYERQLTEEVYGRLSRLNTERTSLPEHIALTSYIDDFTDIVNDAFERMSKTLEFVGKFQFDDSVLTQLKHEENIPKDTCEKMGEMIKEEPYYPGPEFAEDLIDKIGRYNSAKYRSLILKHVQFKSDSSTSYIIFRLDDGRILMMDQLSAGEKQLLNILLATLILVLRSLASDGEHSLILLDEPELSLHMRWQKDLIDYIRRINENIQIIIATHSPDILKKGWMDRAIGVDEIRRR